jgi:putative aldouronate transport system permease protein
MRKTATADLVFYFLVYIVASFALLVTLYPFIYVFSVSFSSSAAINLKQVFLFPVDIDLTSYNVLFHSSLLWTAYYNTIWYTVVGTAFNLIFTCLAAYPLSRPTFFARKFFNFIIVFTIYFSGGLIPFFVLINKIGLYNTRWVLILPSLVIPVYLMICRTSFENIPAELFESAKIEGASDITVLFKIVMPLSKAIIAVLALYYAIGHWNEFFGALLFLPSQELQPLQIVLRRIIIMASPEIMQKMGNAMGAQMTMSQQQLKFATIIVTIGPILLVYPFVQRYIIKGVMLGAVKG